MDAPMVAIKIKEPLPGTNDLAAIDEVNPAVTEVEIGTQAPGGYAEARIGMTLADLDRPDVYPSLPGSYQMRDKAHVEIDIGGFRAHEGIMQRFAVAQDGFTSLGYGLAAAPWGSIETGGSHTGNGRVIALEAIRSVPWWNVGEVADPGARRVWDDVRWQPPAAVIDSLITEGDTISPYTFLVYKNRMASIRALVPPTRPHYHVSYDRSFMDLDYDVSQVVDGARMVYVNSVGFEQATSYIPASGVNLMADSHLRLVTLSGSSADGSLALAFVQAFVAYYSQKLLTGTITYDDWQGPDGVAGYRVQAGQWVQFGTYGMAMVASTTSNLSTGTTQIQLGAPPLATLAGVLRRADRSTVRNERGVNPLTGVPERNRMPYDLMAIIQMLAEAVLPSKHHISKSGG